MNHYIIYVLTTRRYGSTYIHSAMRHIDVDTPEITFSWRSYGRSLSAGGNKYKAYAHYVTTGKPVPTKTLLTMVTP